jgi:hypothetical protein
MATSYQIAFIHKDDFYSDRDYTAAPYDADVAKLYSDSEFFNFDFPDAESFIDSGGTWESRPKAQRAIFSVLLTTWEQTNIINAGNETAGYNNHVVIIYEDTGAGFTPIMSGVFTWEAGSTRSLEIKITAYNFLTLFEEALKTEIDIGLKENAGEFERVDRIGTYQGGYLYEAEINTNIAYSLPNPNDTVFAEIGEERREYTVITARENGILDLSSSLFRVNTSGQIAYDIEYSRNLTSVYEALTEISDRTQMLYFARTDALSIAQNFDPLGLDYLVDEVVFNTNYANLETQSTVGPNDYHERAIGFYLGDDNYIHFIEYDYLYLVTTRTPVGFFWFEYLFIKQLKFEGPLWEVEVDNFESPITASGEVTEDATPDPDVYSELWGTFETTLSDPITLGTNTYTLINSDEQIQFTGYFYLTAIRLASNTYTMLEIFEALAFFNQLTIKVDATGNLTIRNKYSAASPTTVSLTDRIAGTTLIPQVGKMAFDREIADYSWLLNGGSATNRGFQNIAQLVAAVQFKTFDLFRNTSRYIEFEHSSHTNPPPDIGDTITVNAVNYYVIETQRIGMKSQKTSVRAYEINSSYAAAAGVPITDYLGFFITDESGNFLIQSFAYDNAGEFSEAYNQEEFA